MKFIILAIIFLLSSIQADDLQRVKSIVNDITQLRVKYNKVGDDLAICQYNLQDEKEKNNILIEESKYHNNDAQKAKIYKNRIVSLENQIKKLKKELLGKEKSNKNPFPHLKMKPEYSIMQMKASSYRVNKDANIYDAIGGDVIDTWEEKTSFTSNQKTQNWIKITGYFVEKIWRPATKEMWVRVGDAHKRSKAH